MCDGREVATARAVTVRRSELDLPEKALAQANPFDPAAAPPMAEPNRSAADVVGWECFDSWSLIIDFARVEGDRRVHQWIRLAVPVVEGSETQGVELAAVVADYAESSTSRLLSMAEWSYRNAELTVHLAREPVGSWIGARCESVVQPVGAGFNASDLFDADGRFGRSAAAVVVERRGIDGSVSAGSLGCIVTVVPHPQAGIDTLCVADDAGASVAEPRHHRPLDFWHGAGMRWVALLPGGEIDQKRDDEFFGPIPGARTAKKLAKSMAGLEGDGPAKRCAGRRKNR